MYFPAKRLALVVIKRPKGITHFVLVLVYPKRDDKTFSPMKASIDVWMLCGPLTPQLIDLIHHSLD